jgi:hypothetical protein
MLSEQEKAKSQILHVAKKLLIGEMGVIAGSRLLSSLRHSVDGEIAEALLIFAGIDSESDTLPIGEVRQHWRADALEIKDLEIAEYESACREDALEAAIRLIYLIETPS